MELKILRTKFFETHTIGQLYIDGELFCFTLEDKVREVKGQAVDKWKIKGETAIPTGTYKVTLEYSGKFGADCPTICNVPGFTYIRIHAGLTDKDTEGCIIVGYKLTNNDVIMPGTTRTARDDLRRKLKEHHGPINITIQ